jgi:hypothetical protein
MSGRLSALWVVVMTIPSLRAFASGSSPIILPERSLVRGGDESAY